MPSGCPVHTLSTTSQPRSSFGSLFSGFMKRGKVSVLTRISSSSHPEKQKILPAIAATLYRTFDHNGWLSQHVDPSFHFADILTALYQQSVSISAICQHHGD